MRDERDRAANTHRAPLKAKQSQGAAGMTQFIRDKTSGFKKSSRIHLLVKHILP